MHSIQLDVDDRSPIIGSSIFFSLQTPYRCNDKSLTLAKLYDTFIQRWSNILVHCRKNPGIAATVMYISPMVILHGYKKNVSRSIDLERSGISAYTCTTS